MCSIPLSAIISPLKGRIELDIYPSIPSPATLGKMYEVICDGEQNWSYKLGEETGDAAKDEGARGEMLSHSISVTSSG
jgi:hypothetical protein